MYILRFECRNRRRHGRVQVHPDLLGCFSIEFFSQGVPPAWSIRRALAEKQRDGIGRSGSSISADSGYSPARSHPLHATNSLSISSTTSSNGRLPPSVHERCGMTPRDYTTDVILARDWSGMDRPLFGGNCSAHCLRCADALVAPQPERLANRRRSLINGIGDQSTLRLTAEVFPCRPASRSKLTLWPSLRVVSPARSTAEMWTKTSARPLSGWMKPKPFCGMTAMMCSSHNLKHAIGTGEDCHA
jgi:hypothetical protein